MTSFEVNCLFQCRNAANDGQRSQDLGQKWANFGQMKKFGVKELLLGVLRVREIPARLKGR
jgi:threonyl-tRNA synthetase